jgi:hypothetical protein
MAALSAHILDRQCVQGDGASALVTLMTRCGSATRLRITVPCADVAPRMARQRPRRLIIRLIIQAIRRDPSGAVWTDGASNVSRPDPSGADQIDVERQATDLAVWPWRCWPMPHLAVPFPARHASGSGRFRYRLFNRPLPQCPRAPAAVAGVHRGPAARGSRVAPGRIRCRTFGPPMSAAAPTCPGTQARPAEPDTAAVSAGRPGWRPGAGRTAAIRRGHGRSPLSRAGTWRSPAADRPCTPAPATAVDANRRRRCLRRQRNLHAGGCPDEGVRRTACRRSLRTLWQCPRCVRHCGRLAMVSGRRCPPRTPPSPAGGCCYRKRSPARRPLDGCCGHRR